MKAVPTTPLEGCKKNLKIEMFNFGCKHVDKLPGAELYLDCRGVANPSHGGPGGTGDDPQVQDWVRYNSDLTPYCLMIQDALSRLITRKGEGHEFDKPFRIATFCAHGIHRSRAIKHLLANFLNNSGYLNVKVD